MTDMNESRFEVLADETLNHMVDALADLEEDTMDVDLESGVLTIRFDDGTKYVVNSHRAAKQIWMAAESTAWHYDYDGKAWMSTKTQEELWSTVSSWVGKKLGHAIDISS